MMLNIIKENINQPSNDIDPSLKSILQDLLSHVETQSGTIANTKNELIFLKKKVNDLERSSSIDCIIINNLPLRHGSDYVEDVIAFFREAIDIYVPRDSKVACHPLGPIRDIKTPQPLF